MAYNKVAKKQAKTEDVIVALEPQTLGSAISKAHLNAQIGDVDEGEIVFKDNGVFTSDINLRFEKDPFFAGGNLLHTQFSSVNALTPLSGVPFNCVALTGATITGTGADDNIFCAGPNCIVLNGRNCNVMGRSAATFNCDNATALGNAAIIQPVFSGSTNGSAIFGSGILAGGANATLITQDFNLVPQTLLDETVQIQASNRSPSADDAVVIKGGSALTKQVSLKEHNGDALTWSYTPSVPANWTVVPTTIGEALDRIAAALGPI